MVKRFVKKAIKDIPQQLNRSVDFYPGITEVYDHNTKQEWNYPENWHGDYSNQSNIYNNSIATNLPKGLSKEQLFEVMSRQYNLSREQFEELLQNSKPKTASSDIIEEIVEKVKGTDTVEDVLESESPDSKIKIEMKELGNGAVAETLPDGTILINDDIAEVDDFTASRLVHELSHYVDWQDTSYLDRPEEQNAFTSQIQYLLEVGNSEKEIKEMLLPIFDDYKENNGEEALDRMIDKAKKKLKEASKTLSKVAKNETLGLTFTPEESAILEKVKTAAEQLGIKVFLAGGLIRDRLLGIPNEDLDFVTNKGSEKLAAHLAKANKLSQPIKMDRSGASMIHMGDRYLDIIDAEKVFAPVGTAESLEQGNESEMSIFMDDAYRRDLTINSLMYGLSSGKLYDPTGKGLSDLKSRVIRTIIDPYLKYRIHAPDMLRALRFYASKPGFKFAPGMLDAMKENVFRIKSRQQGGDTSSRRIERELRKASTPEEWAKLKAALAEIGAYEYIEDEIKAVDADKKGGIKYNLDKAASAQKPDEKTNLASVIVTNNKGEILMGLRSGDDKKWTLPGGHFKNGETAIQAARRELKEETDIDLPEDSFRYLGTKEINTPNQKNEHIHCYVVEIDKQDPNSKDDPDHEVSKWHFIDISEGIPEHIKNNLHHHKDDASLDYLGLVTKTASDFAGRPITETEALPSEIIAPYSTDHGNYNASEILKRKELQRKVKKLKELSNRA